VNARLHQAVWLEFTFDVDLALHGRRFTDEIEGPASFVVSEA